MRNGWTGWTGLLRDARNDGEATRGRRDATRHTRDAARRAAASLKGTVSWIGGLGYNDQHGDRVVKADRVQREW